MSAVFLQVAGSIMVAVLSLVGVVITVKSGNTHIQTELDKHNAIQDERIRNLTAEVRKHNGFAERIPKVETEILDLKNRVNRLEDRR